MPPLTKTQWRQARIEWESNPDLTVAELAKRYNVSRNTVFERIRKEGWRRPCLEDVKKAPLPQSVEAYASGVDNVLQRHRHEWEEHRALFELNAIASDFELGKAAKISAEMLAIRQKAERLAWGIVDDSTKDEVIIVERSYANGYGDSSGREPHISDGGSEVNCA